MNRETRRAAWTGVSAAAMLMLLSCGKPENPNDLPVSHWLDDGDDCTRAAAAAIIQSGLPFPNYGTQEVPPAASGAKPARRITSVDMWLGPTRLVIPAKVAGSNGFDPAHHPHRYDRLAGSLPNFYPPGPPGPEVDGMGSMVDVRFICSMEPKFAASWGTGPKSNAESIENAKRQYEQQLGRSQFPGEITVNRRDDIGMIEVLMDRREQAKGQRYWEASYWPIDTELRGQGGSVSSIGCATRHDPIEHRYGNRGWRCTSSLRVTPHAVANIDIYVSQIQHMPAVFEQVKQVLIDSQASASTADKADLTAPPGR